MGQSRIQIRTRASELGQYRPSQMERNRPLIVASELCSEGEALPSIPSCASDHVSELCALRGDPIVTQPQDRCRKIHQEPQVHAWRPASRRCTIMHYSSFGGSTDGCPGMQRPLSPAADIPSRTSRAVMGPEPDVSRCSNKRASHLDSLNTLSAAQEDSRGVGQPVRCSGRYCVGRGGTYAPHC
jgi:hypothetical protein